MPMGGGIDPSTCQGTQQANLYANPYTFTDDYAFVIVFTFSSSQTSYTDKFLLNNKPSNLQYFGTFFTGDSYYSFVAFSNVKKGDILSGSINNVAGRMLLYK